MKTTQKISVMVAIVVLFIIGLCFALKKDTVLVAIPDQAATTTPSSDQSTVPMVAATSTFPVSATSTSPAPNVTITQNPVSITEPFLLYSVTTDKKTYTRDEQINITLSILNNSNAVRTFDFANGCQGTYSINGFNMIQHMRCLPGTSSATIAAHSAARIPLVNYPSVNKIPVGTYPLYASMIGYGGATTTVTITNN